MSNRTVRLNDRFVARARIFSRAASVLVMLVGALALAGWLFDVTILKEWHAGIAIKANTSIALLLSGASLWLLGVSRYDTWSRRVGQAFAVVVGAIGIATFSQHLFGWDLGIDQLLFMDEPGALATASPGRMGPPASACFTLAGTALLLLHARKFASLAQGLSIGIGLIALLPITGYAYGTQTLYGVAGYTDIALNTAIALLALSAGLLSWSLDRGVVSVMASDGAGSLMARRLLPFAIAVPLLLGWLRTWLQDAGYIETRFGIAAFALAIIVILAALIARTAVMLNRVERQKIAAEEERANLLALEQEARAEAEKANRAKDEFLATVSHELRTPLNAILGWTGVLRAGSAMDEAVRQDALATIDRNCRAQAQLIEDLLDVSRITAGNLRLDVKPVNLVEVVKAAAEGVRPVAEARKIQLRMALDSATSQVCGDAERLQQVVWNILTNAVKFSAKGGSVEIQLTTGAADATVVIRDAGEGIDSEFLPYVFDRFRQGNGVNTRRNSGLGLGLSIARKLVEMHGGTLEAASPGIGRGASFTVRLPLHLSDAVAPRAANPRVPTAG